MLAPTARGLVITVKQDDNLGRQNFSVCHEICHTLFPSPSQVRATVRDLHTGTFPLNDEVEYLCDFGASCLLMPAKLVQEGAKRHPVGIAALEALASGFGASLEAIAMRLAQLDVWAAAVVVFEEKLKPTQVWQKRQLALPGMEAIALIQPELRVRLACIPASLDLFIPIHKSIRRTGPVYEALKTKTLSRGIDIIQLPSGAFAFETESAYVPYWHNGVTTPRVISVMKPLGLA